MELTSGSRVAVVGGGPAGSMTAYFLRELSRHMGIALEVDIYEPKEFFVTGPTGCNMCGGVVSESLVQHLATDGINLPREVVMHTIEAYSLHTDLGQVVIPTPVAESRIAVIFRGGGPKGAENQRPLPWDSFDWFLLQRAVSQGAHHIPKRVTGLSRDATGRPVVTTGEGESATYDLLVGAVGLNSPALPLFEELGFGYRRPKAARAFIAEFYYGSEEVERLLGHTMRIFVLDIPRLEFAALTPKGPYATFIILGQDVDRELADQVLHAPEVKACFPEGWEAPVQPCQCQPRIFMDDPRHPYGDRVVMVGDTTVSRLYKDGIGAAYRTAKAAAVTALLQGVSKAAFRKYYYPTCRTISRDNRLGRMVFMLVWFARNFRFVRRAMLATIGPVEHRRRSGRMLGSALWDTFTGSAPYKEILWRALHPRVIARMVWEAGKAVVRHEKRGGDG